MPRCLSGLLAVLVIVSSTLAQTAEPVKPPAIARAVALQRAMADARDLLGDHRPAEAARKLEAELHQAEGNKAFLGVLRDAYLAELQAANHTPADAGRLAVVRERLILLGETPPPLAATPAEANPWHKPPAPAVNDAARTAALAFQQGKWADAASHFAQAAKVGTLSPDETTAWAYCRIKASADLAPAERTVELAAALALVPGHAALQALALASRPAGAKNEAAIDTTTNALAPGMIETESFRVRFMGKREMAEAVAKAAEAKRKELFDRWSGPVTGHWEPKCDITLHPEGETYARLTKRPAGGTGHANVRIAEGRVAERTIDLRADDAGVTQDSLPRELTHVVLADLFPDSPPPRWAEAGMAVLASSAGEIERYTRTLPRCARAGELFAVETLFELKDYPAAEKLTGFYCESLSLVEYLVKLRGERNFTIFLRDTRRYGLASALKKTYQIESIAALERHWQQQALASTRAQSP